MNAQATAEKGNHGIEIRNDVVLSQVGIVWNLICQCMHTLGEKAVKAYCTWSGGQYRGDRLAWSEVLPVCRNFVVGKRMGITLIQALPVVPEVDLPCFTINVQCQSAEAFLQRSLVESWMLFLEIRQIFVFQRHSSGGSGVCHAISPY